jgi:hypothetical protein
LTDVAVFSSTDGVFSIITSPTGPSSIVIQHLNTANRFRPLRKKKMKIPRSLLTAVLLLTGFSSAQVFTLTDIGSNVSPRGINKYAQVAVNVTNGGVTHAGIWYRGRIQDLGVLPGGTNSTASSINDHGDVVGDTDGEATWWPSPGVGSVTDVGATLHGFNLFANSIDDSRVITGQDGFEVGYVWFVFSPPTTAITFGRGLIDRGEGVAIDNFGNVAADGDGMAFIWNHNSGGTDTGILNSTSSAISNGVIVGQAGPPDQTGAEFCNQFDKTKCTKLFIWSKANGVQYLGQLPGQTFGLSRGINAFRQVVGSSGTLAFYWSHSTGMLDLNRLVKAPGWQLVIATGINDKAQIVGSGLLNGIEHGFLLTVRK